MKTSHGPINLTRNRCGKSGFSLVELLVVMGIIAILVAVSLGPITSMIKSGQAVKCSSNLRQIGTGFTGYLADHNNVMPQRIYGNGTGYFIVLAPYTGNNVTDKTSSVFVCPVHTACSFPTQPSYGMNWYYDNCSVMTVPGVSTTIMVAESAGGLGTGSNRADRDSGDPGELDTTRHNGASNYLFFDGHVEKLQYASTTNYWGTNMGNHNLQSP
jgi:prepilin-type processing-associated H-X9-DG protein/prepilin-type N-terminal cleavage/methylation domain-containing protein